MVKFRDITHYVWSIPYVKHPLLGVLLGVLIVVIVFVSLSLFTRHGREFPVPDFRTLPLDEANGLADREGLQLVISDSTYVIGRRPGEVLEQQPKPGSKVKKGRNVFLLVNALSPQLIEAPNALGVPIKRAILVLNRAGLEVGKVDFVYDVALGEVRQQRYRGRPISPGEQIPKGARVDLTLGNGETPNRQSISPRLEDMTLREARNALAKRFLNVGKVTYDETVKNLSDSLKAKVYSSYPPSNARRRMGLGAPVDLWMTLNQARIDNPKQGKPSS
ncbi:MAG: hypothetical protein CSA97_04040 [Bacteroidetes bacterium]|nr:MAG: hypothetical protein CSA97_04040 [Bacteroidota bacterium]